MGTDAAKCPACDDTVEEQEKLRLIGDFIDRYKEREGSLIQVLHVAQQTYGYLPLHLQKFIADRMGKPLSEVSGVVTFYSFFSTQPRGKHTIRVCLGTACYVRGGKKIVDKLQDVLGVGVGNTTDDQLFTFEVARCIGACGLAPAMMIDDEVFKQVNAEKVEAILSRYADAEA
ncbi:MAG: NAD(P)H-dependent oxidoreductase subunit E [Clostridia bacterium]|nr:NAD(P)H-dependent oxidoreductase subunit E [Clostridia bacterium]